MFTTEELKIAPVLAFYLMGARQRFKDAFDLDMAVSVFARRTGFPIGEKLAIYCLGAADLNDRV